MVSFLKDPSNSDWVEENLLQVAVACGSDNGEESAVETEEEGEGVFLVRLNPALFTH
jgi:hypothetical protein